MVALLPLSQQPRPGRSHLPPAPHSSVIIALLLQRAWGHFSGLPLAHPRTACHGFPITSCEIYPGNKKSWGRANSSLSCWAFQSPEVLSKHPKHSPTSVPGALVLNQPERFWESMLEHQILGKKLRDLFAFPPTSPSKPQGH